MRVAFDNFVLGLGCQTVGRRSGIFSKCPRRFRPIIVGEIRAADCAGESLYAPGGEAGFIGSRAPVLSLADAPHMLRHFEIADAEFA